MFVGLYRYAVDLKGRLFLPAKFRAKNHFIVTIGLDKCLYVYPKNTWEKLENKLEILEFKNKSEERAFKRVLLSGATEVVPDAQGRILIPQTLRNYAGIKKDVVIIGASYKIEIWAVDIWRAYYKSAEKIFAKHAGSLEI